MSLSPFYRIGFWLRLTDFGLAAVWCVCAYFFPNDASWRSTLGYISAVTWLVSVSLVGGYRQDHLYPPRRLAISIGVPLFLTAICGVISVWGDSGWLWYQKAGLLSLAFFGVTALISRMIALFLAKAPTYQLIPYRLSDEYGSLLQELGAVASIRVEQALADPADPLPPIHPGYRTRLIVADLQIDEENFIRLLPLYEQAEVVDLGEFYEAFFGKVAIVQGRNGWMTPAPLRTPSVMFDAEKRLIDFIVCCCLAPIALMVILIAALAVRCTSRGPVLFVQDRIGRYGKHFRMYKLRTMTCTAEEEGPRWAAGQDKRITPVGRVLRASGIDELPQLWNVLRGEMTLVGPRPESPDIAKQLTTQIPFYQARQLVLSGLTGWAQLHQGSDLTIHDVASKLRYDLYYLKHASVVLDFQILLMTIQMLLHMAKPAPAAQRQASLNHDTPCRQTADR